MMSQPNPPASAATQAAVNRIIERFEQLTPQGVDALGELYTTSARFRDPFNNVQGLAAIQQVFRHMYLALDQPRFVITGKVVDEGQCFLTWEFLFRMRRFQPQVEQKVIGGSHLLLAPDGRIRLHRDYWDAAEELYEKLPLVGSLMRWLKRRANS